MTIEKQVQALQNQIRFLSILFGLTLSILVFFVLTGFTTRNAVPDVIRAKKFEVIDDAGNVLVNIRSGKSDIKRGVIEGFNSVGKEVWYLGSSLSGGGRFYLTDANYEISHILGGSKEDKTPFILMNNKSGKMSIYLEGGNKSGRIWTYDDQGNKKSWLTTCDSGTGCICFYDQNGNLKQCY